MRCCVVGQWKELGWLLMLPAVDTKLTFFLLWVLGPLYLIPVELRHRFVLLENECVRLEAARKAPFVTHYHLHN